MQQQRVRTTASSGENFRKHTVSFQYLDISRQQREKRGERRERDRGGGQGREGEGGESYSRGMGKKMGSTHRVKNTINTGPTTKQKHSLTDRILRVFQTHRC